MEGIKPNNLDYFIESHAWCQCHMQVKIDPMMEAFFIAVALEHGTSPAPKFGNARNLLREDIAGVLSQHAGAPEAIDRIEQSYRELGGRQKDINPMWFYVKLADLYLNWLYSQEASKELLSEVMKANGYGDYPALTDWDIEQRKLKW